MPNEGKPEALQAPVTESQGSDTQLAEQASAIPTVEMDDSVKSYLKGLGLENVQATPELVKVAQAGMKQKESVSKKSLEVEQLLARLASQGKDTNISAPAEPAQPQVEMPQEPAPAQTIGVSDNDLFDLGRTIYTDFPELKEQAEDGSLFKELRQLGYFTSKGIDKRAVYDYLSVRNSSAKELRELREFKEKYSQPDPSNNPVYNAQPGFNLRPTDEMTAEAAHNIVLSGNSQNPRYAEALQFLRNKALK